MTTVSERLSVHIDDPSLNGKDGLDKHSNGTEPINSLPRLGSFISPRTIPTLDPLESAILVRSHRNGKLHTKSWDLQDAIRTPYSLPSLRAAADRLGNKLRPQGFEIEAISNPVRRYTEWAWHANPPEPLPIQKPNEETVTDTPSDQCAQRNSANTSSSPNGHSVNFNERELALLTTVADSVNPVTDTQMICAGWQGLYKKDGAWQLSPTVSILNAKLRETGSPLRVRNIEPDRHLRSLYALVDVADYPDKKRQSHSSPYAPVTKEHQKNNVTSQSLVIIPEDTEQERLDEYWETARIQDSQRRIGVIPDEKTSEDARQKFQDLDPIEIRRDRIVNRNSQLPTNGFVIHLDPPIANPRTQELRAHMLAHNPIQPSDGTVIEARMPLGPLVEDSHRALKKISPSPSLQDSIQKFEAFKQEQRRQKVQGRWDQRQQRIETRKRIQEWTHEQQAQITTTQIPEVAEEAERQRQAKAADEVRLEQVRVHFKTEWEDLPERTEDDQVLIDFNQRNEDYKKSQALERDLLLLLRANGHNGVHHYHLKKFARDHGFQSPADLLKQIPGLRKNGMSIRHTLERGGGRFYLNGDVSSQESREEPQTEKPAHSVQTPAVASAPVVKPKVESPKPPYEMADAPIKRENPQEPQLELSPFERRLGEVKTRLNGPPQMVFDAFLRLQAQNKPTTPEAIAWEAFPSWTPEKAMIRYQKGVDELRVVMNTQGLDITTYFDEAGSTLVNFERTSKKTS